MLFKVVIDIDPKNTFSSTITVTFENSIEHISRYTVTTKVIKYDNSILFKKTEIMNHERALKYITALKEAQAEHIIGIDVYKKQTLITKKNPYISHDEYIKRFLWE